MMYYYICNHPEEVNGTCYLFVNWRMVVFQSVLFFNMGLAAVPCFSDSQLFVNRRERRGIPQETTVSACGLSFKHCIVVYCIERFYMA